MGIRPDDEENNQLGDIIAVCVISKDRSTVSFGAKDVEEPHREKDEPSFLTQRLVWQSAFFSPLTAAADQSPVNRQPTQG